MLRDRDREGKGQEPGSVARNNCPSWTGKGQAVGPQQDRDVGYTQSCCTMGKK